MSEKKLEECSLADATHVEINGVVYQIVGNICTYNIGLRWLEEDVWIPIELFPILGIKPLRERKREPVVFEAIVQQSRLSFLFLDNVPEGVPLGTKFKCVQILDGEEMTLEEALERNKFLEKALKGAIALACIEQVRCCNGKPLQALKTSPMLETCNFEDEPELAEYIMEEKK